MKVLTMMVDGVDEANSDVGVVVAHKNHVESLLLVGVYLEQAPIHFTQSLRKQHWFSHSHLTDWVTD